MNTLLKVNQENFETEVLQSPLVVLLSFVATGSQPCKILAHELEALGNDLAGKVKVIEVDIDESPALAEALRIQSVPTLVVIKEGRPVDAAQGVLKKEAIKTLLVPHLPRAQGAILVPEAFELSKNKQCTFVDTRDPAVFKRSRIEGSINLPLLEVESRLGELLTLPAPPILYCRTGKESAELGGRLSESGTPLAFLEGGVLAWEGEGHRLMRPPLYP